MEEVYLVFLHGWGGSIKSLAKLSDELISLSKKTNDTIYKPLLLEMPGHGATQQMDRPWDMGQFSKWLEINLKDNKIENYILIGHSFGGKIILDSLVNKRLKPQKIILIDTNGVKPKNSFKKKFWKFISKIYRYLEKLPFAKKLRKILYRYIIREQDYLKTNEMVRESFKLFNEQHYDHLLENIKIDTLIIWGKNDKVTPLWMGEKLNQKIEGSELKILEGTHGLPLKNPKEVALLINSFINND
jgi:pimeloyl-ACP methyl ester carboxylesterase